MSDVITKVGPYRQVNDEKATVVHIENGIGFGFDSNGSACGWDVKTGEESGVNNDEGDYCLAGPWQDPPFSVGDTVLVNSPNCVSPSLHQQYGTIERVSDRHTVRFNDGGTAYFNTSELTRVTLPAPPDGFFIQPRSYVEKLGDKHWETNPKASGGGTWFDSSQLRSAAERDEVFAYCAPHYTASPIPVKEPFSISQHGCGVYETRDGREATVEDKDGADCWEWSGRLPVGGVVLRATWMNCGTWRADKKESEAELVKYLRPLPVVAPEKWEPTCELRWSDGKTNASTLGQLSLDSRLEQRWTCGDREQWRAVQVTQCK